MAIGLTYGRDRLEEITASEGLKALDLSAKLYDRFKEEFGSIKCSDIQKKIFGRGLTLEMKGIGKSSLRPTIRMGAPSSKERGNTGCRTNT